MGMTRHFKRARGCGPLLIGLVGLWLAGEGASEPFVWVDESGHTHFGHGTAPKRAVADIDGLRSLWDGRVTGHRAPLRRDGEDAVGSRWSEATSDNFRIWLDGRLAEGRAPSPRWTLGALEAARKTTESVLGVVPTRPLRVILYAENTYARLHGARFGFETVGFYDGGIHVVAPADRPDVLRARIHHEYAHAVFRDRVGDDRPYWLNEGWATYSETLWFEAHEL